MGAPILHLPLVAIVNKSTIVTDDEVRTAIAALQKQVSNDFAPAGWVDAILTFVPAGAQAQAGAWPLYLGDNSDQAGALGYHETAQAGSPVGFSFAATDKQYGVSWSRTLSHELLEMLADPWIFCTGIHQTSATASIDYALEVCDAVEADALGYEIDSVGVSNFVYPAYFMDAPPPGAKFDHMGHLPGPFSIAPQGYASMFVQGKGWTQTMAETTPRGLARAAKGRFTRGARRIAGIRFL